MVVLPSPLGVSMQPRARSSESLRRARSSGELRRSNHSGPRSTKVVSGSERMCQISHEDGVTDGLAGAHLAASDCQPVVLGGQIGALGACSRHGGHGQVALEPAVALAGGALLGLAGRLVLSGAHARPRGQMAWRGELGHVDADLADDGLSDAPIHARDRAQPLPGVSERGDALVDRVGEPADGLVGVVELADDLGHQDGVGGPETALEGRTELGQLLAQQPFGQIGQHGRILGARDQRHEHGASRSSQDVRRHRGQLDARILEHLVEALRLAGPLFDNAASIAGQLSDLSDLRRRDEAGPHQAVLGQLADPLGVAHVGLAPRHVAHVAGVQEPAIELLFEQVQDRLPIDAGGLHAHPGDPEADQPVPQGEQVLGEGGERRHLGLSVARRHRAPARRRRPSPCAHRAQHSARRRSPWATSSSDGWNAPRREVEDVKSRARARSGIHRCSGPPMARQSAPFAARPGSPAVQARRPMTVTSGGSTTGSSPGSTPVRDSR